MVLSLACHQAKLFLEIQGFDYSLPNIGVMIHWKKVLDSDMKLLHYSQLN